jgi:hypothetical protein
MKTLLLLTLCALLAVARCHAQANPVPQLPPPPDFPLPDPFDLPDDPPGLDGFPEPPFDFPIPIDDFPPDPWDLPPPLDDPWNDLPPLPDLPDPWGDDLDLPSLFPDGLSGDSLGYSPLQFKPEPLPLPFRPSFGPDVHLTPSGGPAACTQDQDTRELVVAASKNELFVIGTCPHRVLMKMTTGVGPVAAVSDPTGSFVLVSNNGSGSLTLIDIEAYTVLATIPLPLVNGIPASPGVIAFSPDGGTAYVANHSDVAAGIFVLNMASRTVTATLSSGAFPGGIRVSPDGAQLWVTCRGNSTVHVYDTLTNTEIRSLNELEPLGIAFNPSGTRAYITLAPDNAPGTFKVIDTATFAELVSIPMGNLPSAILVSSTGRNIFVNHLQSNFITQIDGLHNTMLRNLTVKAPWRIIRMHR